VAYVIAEPCIGVKDNSCVEVCPVDCIHPTPDEPDYEQVDQLYIDPEECIDCDAYVEGSPAPWTRSPPRTKCPKSGSASSSSTPTSTANKPHETRSLTRRLKALPRT
jgi:NAD-dependent dihydropyrimidine dehydrogenase PreA subunit